MWKCPICNSINEENKTGSICYKCQFDQSLDYENFPTLQSFIPNERLSLMSQKNKFQTYDKLICPYCKNNQFNLSPDSSQLLCVKCGKKVPQSFLNNKENGQSNNVQSHIETNEKGFHNNPNKKKLFFVIGFIAALTLLIVISLYITNQIELNNVEKDRQILSAFQTAAISAYSSEAYLLDSNSIYQIIIDHNGINVTTYSGTSNSKAETALKEFYSELIGGLISNDYNFSTFMNSKAGKDIEYVSILIDGGTGSVNLSVTNQHSQKYQVVLPEKIV